MADLFCSNDGKPHNRWINLNYRLCPMCGSFLQKSTNTGSSQQNPISIDSDPPELERQIALRALQIPRGDIHTTESEQPISTSLAIQATQRTSSFPRPAAAYRKADNVIAPILVTQRKKPTKQLTGHQVQLHVLKVVYSQAQYLQFEREITLSKDISISRWKHFNKESSEINRKDPC